MKSVKELKASPKDRILAWADKHGLTMACEFVPLSQSRNKGEKSPTLNWKIAIKKRRASAGKWVDGDELTILTTDYSAGCGHCPAYKAVVVGGAVHVGNVRRAWIADECETGRATYIGLGIGPKGAPILPDLDSVLWSLAMDYSVIDAGGFESWASELGYDTDSRKAEATYRACLDIALALRAALGDAAMQELREAGQDY